MAEAEELLDHEQFSCSVCLDLLKNPVTIPCGHSYCMDCIKGCWNQEDHAGVYRCPQCRQTFIPRPVLSRNALLAQVVEKLQKTRFHAAPPADPYTGPGDVECDVCVWRKNKAVKSCLVCLASYCKTHLQPHYDSAPLGKHKLVDATGHLKDKICSHHDKLLDIYCHTDQQCICYLCVMDEHKGHDTVTVAAGRSERQEDLVTARQKLQQQVEDREEELEKLRQAADSITRSTQTAVEDTDRIFAEMTHSIERRCSEVKDLIRAQEEAVVTEAVGLREQLKQEIEDLRRRDSEAEEFLKTEDHFEFLNCFQALSRRVGCGRSSIIRVNPRCSFGNMRKAVSKLRDHLEDVCKNELTAISAEAKGISPLLPVKPETREDFLKYACEVTLDPSTVKSKVYLTNENRNASLGSFAYFPRDECPAKLEHWKPVLCKEGLSSYSYWEVEWGGDSGVHIAVAYKGIITKWGFHQSLGKNDKSWSLHCAPSRYCFYHNNVKTAVSGPRSSTIGVFLDHRAGTLSFYSISDTMTLLHRVQTTFTEPLYPGFALLCGSSVSLCRLEMSL